MLKLLSLRARQTVRRSQNAAERGSTIVEFALIAPIFLFFLMGVIEISLVLLIQHVFESTVFNSSRTAKTGYVDVGGGLDQRQTVMAQLNANLAGLSTLLNPALITVTTTSFGSIPDLAVPTSGVANSLGAPSEMLVMTVSYPWTFFTPLIGDLLEDTPGTRTRNIEARIVVRNEPPP